MLLPGNLVTGSYSLSARAPCFFVNIAQSKGVFYSTLTHHGAGNFLTPYESAPRRDLPENVLADFPPNIPRHFS